MRHFLKLAEHIDVTPLLAQVYRQPELWNAVPLRTQTPGSPHREADDILLRCQPLDGSGPDKRECVDFPAFAQLPQARGLVYALMAQTQGSRLGRVMLTRLAPGKQIYPHTDIGDHPLHYDHEPYWARYHLVLQADAGAIFRVADEVVRLAPGEAWWVNTALEHDVVNEGQVDRMHLITDVHHG